VGLTGGSASARFGDKFGDKFGNNFGDNMVRCT
jgi:hypothetical protein